MPIEHPRAFQVEVHVDLPREAHAAEHLRRGLAVGDRGLARHHLGAGNPRSRSVGSEIDVVEMRARRVDGRARDLGAHEHVGAQVLDRLERADRAVELHPLLRVRDRQLGAAVGQAELERGRERRTLAAALGRVGVDRVTGR